MTSPYPKYKDSGVEWLGAIPEDWETRPLFATAEPKRRKNVGMKEANLLSLSYGNVVEKDIETSEGLLPESFETYQIVEPNDVVFRFTDLQNDKKSLRSALVKVRGIITSAYLAVTPIQHLPAYFAYLMRAYDLKKVFYAMGGGLRQSMNYDDVRRLPLLLPPIEDQEVIVAYLDSETKKIDELLEKQEALAKALRERRASLIVEVVTGKVDVRGL